MGHLLDALSRAYDALGFPQATGHDQVFRQLVLARIIEPASKQDSLRVLDEAGAPAPSYPTLNRRLPVWAGESWRQGLSEACAVHARLGPASLVLYDVSTPYFEADQGDGFREPGFSKERRLEPQAAHGKPAPDREPADGDGNRAGRRRLDQRGVPRPARYGRTAPHGPPP
jgi:hypothetical protein